MKKLIGFLVAILFVGLTLDATAQRTPKFTETTFASSVKCGMCKKTIESNLGKESGIKEVDVDLKQNTVKVVYRTKKFSKADIQEKISKIGYDADEVVADQKAHDALPACCQKTAKAH